MPFPKRTPKPPMPKKPALNPDRTPVKKQKATPELLRGFRDILPDEQPRWDALRDAVRAMADAYSFGRIDLPILERTELFVRGVGKQTDIVEKEMYAFEDAAGDQVCLRPESTASVC